MISVLFVCLGNICRSPMAEAIMRHKVSAAGLESSIRVDSAGTGDWHIGHEPHQGTKEKLDEHQVSYEGIRARQFTSADFDQFDYIVCMDDSNWNNVKKLTGAKEEKLIKFMDLLPEHELREVPDPYYTGNFEQVYDLMEAGCEALILKIRSEKL
ncbi:low molecular weight phosphotyrosine protein phosphatase [Paenibacillus sp. HJL G12]|uniref:protein-tyrosine-phosphatase n=1 Tax=Paenibacillus dendrobii TaxID=2691084 RepID=A0A7X3IE85_9BACL|nr:low molecular weight protein-tyrosine-phosphatase [Paenibacillus dendrobii]MWV42288.1 low molecular weight phosphotyrosine protein phosphatase [Paenibacillus dendrobii]